MRQFLTLALIGSALVTTAEAQFEDLANKVPSSANIISIINIEKIEASSIGGDENVRGEREKSYAAGLTAIPSETTRLITAAQMDFEIKKPIWQTILAKMSTPVQAARIARNTGGNLDNLSGLPSVLLPTDAYAVVFDQNTVGAMHPGNRQMVARWARSAASASAPSLSPYLTDALRYAQEVGTEIIMAVDLDAVVHPERIAIELPSMKSIKGKGVNISKLTRQLASVRGVTLGIRVTTKAYGSIRVDFNEDVSSTDSFALALMLEILGDAGMMVDDLDAWTGGAKGKSIIMKGELSSAGTRQFLSLIDTSFINTHHQAEQAVQAQEQDPESAQRVASQLYFSSVTKLVGDFKEKKKTRKTLGQMATWMERYAGKIDNLPMLNVDPDLLSYGAYVSNELRGGSGSIRGATMTNRVKQTQAVGQGVSGYYNRDYGYGGYSRYGYGSSSGTYWRPNNLSEQQTVRTQIKTATNAKANSAALGAMAGIDQATAEIRRRMTQKYSAEFRSGE